MPPVERVSRFSRLELKARLAAGEPLLGVLVRLSGDDLVEMCGWTGFDFVVLDCEHGPADVALLRQHLIAADLHGMPALVRIGGSEPALALRAMDQGAVGVLAPHLDTVADAEALVSSVHYPPLGQRGFAGYTRAGDFGTVDPTELREAYLERTLVLGMIESPTAVANARSIIATPGLDGIMIGPADLRASSGPDDPDPADSMAAVNAELRAQGSWRMDIVSSPAAARAAFEDGANLVVYNLMHAMMAMLSDLDGARPRPPSAAVG